MLNLSPYDDDAFLFHKKVVESKRTSNKNPYLKQKMVACLPQVKGLFVQFDECFANNELNSLSPHGFKKADTNDFLKLYSYKNSSINKLKILITTIRGNRSLNTCQNCTINSVNSMDHFLPKINFPEFVVNPKNLIPICTECNGYKSTSSSEQFLNLYLDKLPSDQYLFVKIDEDLIPTFEIKNRSGINPIIFNKIETHYGKLHLLKRFSRESYRVIAGLENQISSLQGALPWEEIVSCVKDHARKNCITFGANFWESILQLEIVENPQFKAEFLQPK